MIFKFFLTGMYGLCDPFYISDICKIHLFKNPSAFCPTSFKVQILILIFSALVGWAITIKKMKIQCWPCLRLIKCLQNCSTEMKKITTTTKQRIKKKKTLAWLMGNILNTNEYKSLQTYSGIHKIPGYLRSIGFSHMVRWSIHLCLESRKH